MLLAELEIRHSRAVAPTRRVAIGKHWLPTDPAPGFSALPITALAVLPMLHKDPFDPILIAQAKAEGLALVTNDASVGEYPIPTLW